MTFWMGAAIVGAGGALVIVGLRALYRHVDGSFSHWQTLADNPDYRRQRLAWLEAKLLTRPGAAPLLLEKANILRLEGDYLRARACLQAYLQIKPKDDAGWQELAEDSLVLQDLPQARHAAGQARSIDPDYPDYMELEARIALSGRNAGELEQALKLWRSLLQKRHPATDAAKHPRLRVFEQALAGLRRQDWTPTIFRHLPREAVVSAYEDVPELERLFGRPDFLADAPQEAPADATP